MVGLPRIRLFRRLGIVRAANHCVFDGTFVARMVVSFVTIGLAWPALAEQGDDGAPVLHLIPRPPPPYKPGEPFVPPRSSPPFSRKNICDETDPRTSVFDCRKSIDEGKQELDTIQYSIEQGVIGGNTFSVRNRIWQLNRKIEHDTRILQFRQSHETMFPTAPATP